MRRLSSVALLGIGGCLVSGCMFETHGQAEWGIRYGTEITFFSRSAKTADEASTAKMSLDDRIMGLVGPPAPRPPEANVDPAPEPTP